MLIDEALSLPLTTAAKYANVAPVTTTNKVAIAITVNRIVLFFPPFSLIIYSSFTIIKSYRFNNLISIHI